MGQEDISYEKRACLHTIPFQRPERAEGHRNLNQSALEAGLSCRPPPPGLADWTQRDRSRPGTSSSHSSRYLRGH